MLHRFTLIFFNLFLAASTVIIQSTIWLQDNYLYLRELYFVKMWMSYFQMIKIRGKKQSGKDYHVVGSRILLGGFKISKRSFQGSHWDWKTWKNGKAFSSQVKDRVIVEQTGSKSGKIHTKYWNLR